MSSARRLGAGQEITAASLVDTSDVQRKRGGQDTLMRECQCDGL